MEFYPFYVPYLYFHLLVDGYSTSRVKKYRRGEDVRWAQSALNRINNAGLIVDGVLGPRTARALRDFQRANALFYVDGILGEETMTKLKNSCEELL